MQNSIFSPLNPAYALKYLLEAWRILMTIHRVILFWRFIITSHVSVIFWFWLLMVKQLPEALMPHITHPRQMTINLQAPYCASDEFVSTCLPVSIFPSNAHEKVQSARGLASVMSTDSIPLHKHRDSHLHVVHCTYCIVCWLKCDQLCVYWLFHNGWECGSSSSEFR